MSLFYHPTAFKSYTILIIILLLVLTISPFAQEQSRESAAVDPTAAQWSLQFAYEGFYDYKETDTRGEGNNGFFQFRFVAPVPATESFPITLLPRLTARLVQNSQDEFGFGQSDLFVLGIINQWASGRWGIGPQVNFPSQSGFGNTNWGYGLAGAVTQRALNDDLFLALLLQQTWSQNAAGETKASPLGINAILVYQLGDGWYIGNGDYVIRYNWDAQAFFVPFGIRLGKAFINPKGTWNAYIEYASSVIYDSFPGSVASYAIRVNVQYQIPVSL
ncbi:MAG: hypothetical protein JSW63_04395 [Ignavibacterium sp.]|nr:MAG: hypothetical protein JSW63_04395 [Ignavibacterium sp.]